MSLDERKTENKAHNFQYLDNLIHGGVKNLTLDCDIILDSGEESKYLDGIELDVEELVLDGNGHFIDAKGKARIFFNKAKNVTIKNITLKNGFHDHLIEYKYPGGGAIYNEGNLKVIDSLLLNNRSSTGGAVSNYHGDLKIVNSKLCDNESIDEISGDGGAILNIEGNLNIVNSKLLRNYSNNRNRGGGGAIYNTGNLNISNSNLKENLSSGFAGAIYNEGNTAIQNSILSKNAAEYVGSVYNIKGNLKIEDSYLFNNEANNEGGAVYNVRGGLKIINSCLKDNISHGKYEQDGGGAIINAGSAGIKHTTFLNNSTERGNGSVIKNLNGDMNIEDSIFSDNKTRENNGLIYNLQGNLTIDDSKFSKNYSDESGILIFNKHGPVKISNCKISKNTLHTILFNNDYAEIQDTAFNNNQCEYLIFNNPDKSNLVIFNGEITNNQVKSAIYNNGKFFTIVKTAFENNITSRKNCQDVYNKSNLTLIDPKIRCDDKPILNDGKIIIKNSPPDLSHKIQGPGEIIVEGNIQTQKYGFSHLDKLIHESNMKEIVLEEDITFKDYETDFYEGGIELDIDDLVINGNGKTIDGANNSRIFIITAKNIVLKNIVFKNGYSYMFYNNFLNNPGGAIKINAYANVTIINCIFMDNASEENAGALYNKGNLTIYESVLSNNKCTGRYDGGGAILNSGVLMIFDSYFSNNEAENGLGGAIFNTGFLGICSSFFSNNKTVFDFGNTIFNDVCFWNNEYIKLPRNTSEMWSGDVDKSGGKLCIFDSDFSSLESLSETIYNSTGDLIICNSTANDVLIDENNDGLIANENGNVTIRNYDLK